MGDGKCVRKAPKIAESLGDLSRICTILAQCSSGEGCAVRAVCEWEASVAGQEGTNCTPLSGMRGRTGGGGPPPESRYLNSG